MAFGPEQALAVVLGAMFKNQIWAVTTWPFKTVWRLLRKARPSQSESGSDLPVSETEIIDVTPIRRTIR